MAVQDTVGVAVVGCGTVGSSVVRLLTAKSTFISRPSERRCCAGWRCTIVASCRRPDLRSWQR